MNNTDSQLKDYVMPLNKAVQLQHSKLYGKFLHSVGDEENPSKNRPTVKYYLPRSVELASWYTPHFLVKPLAWRRYSLFVILENQESNFYSLVVDISDINKLHFLQATFIWN